MVRLQTATAGDSIEEPAAKRPFAACSKIVSDASSVTGMIILIAHIFGLTYS
jgi:hypothetical protein